MKHVIEKTIFFIILFSTVYYFKIVKHEAFYVINNKITNKKQKSIKNLNNKQLKKEYYNIVNYYGEPDIIINKKNGAVIWDKPGIFKDIMLIDDDQIKEKFLYASFKISLTDKKYQEIYKKYDSVMYNRINKELIIQESSLSNALYILDDILISIN